MARGSSPLGKLWDTPVCNTQPNTTSISSKFAGLEERRGIYTSAGPADTAGLPDLQPSPPRRRGTGLSSGSASRPDTSRPRPTVMRPRCWCVRVTTNSYRLSSASIASMSYSGCHGCSNHPQGGHQISQPPAWISGPLAATHHPSRPLLNRFKKIGERHKARCCLRIGRKVYHATSTGRCTIWTTISRSNLVISFLPQSRFTGTVLRTNRGLGKDRSAHPTKVYLTSLVTGKK